VAGKEAFPHLVNALQDPEATVRISAIYRLADTGEKEAFPHIAKALEDKHADVRMVAMKGLAIVGGKDAVPYLAKGLKSQDDGIRSLAAVSLGGTRSQKALAPLARALNRTDWFVKIYALQAIGEIGGKRAAKYLAQAMEKSPDTRFQLDALRTLGEIKHPLAETYIRQALQHPNSRVQAAAVTLLRYSGKPEVIPELVAVLAGKKKGLHLRAVNAIFNIIDRNPRHVPGDIATRGAYALAPHLLRNNKGVNEDHKLVRRVLTDFTEGRLHDRSIRLYLKELRAMKGRMK